VAADGDADAVQCGHSLGAQGAEDGVVHEVRAALTAGGGDALVGFGDLLVQQSQVAIHLR
jgi:hypothetical protein